MSHDALCSHFAALQLGCGCDASHVGLDYGCYLTVWEWRSHQDYIVDSALDDASNDQTVTGEEIETSQGSVTVYSHNVPENLEAVRDVRLVAQKTGNIVRIADYFQAWIYGQKAVGGVGYVALVKTGMRSKRPIFDFVFVNFPDLRRFVIARGIDSLDTVRELDDQTFSAIV